MFVLTQRSSQQGRKKADSERIVHLMDILIAAILTCEEAKGIISKISPSSENRTELVQMVRDSTQGCLWDAQVD